MAAFIDKFSRFCGSRTLAALIGVNMSVFILLWIAILSGNALGIAGNFTIGWLCVPASTELFASRIWTAATYMVTHYGFLHLLFNMLWLLWFGRLLATTLTDTHLLWLYIGGGLAGALFYVAAQAIIPSLSDSSAYLCGASAAVLSVMVASAIRTPHLRLNLLLFGEVRLIWVAAGCILLTFIGVGGGNSGGQAAHVGGLVFGAAFALAINKGFDIATRTRNAMNARRQKSAPVRRNVNRDGAAVARAASGRLGDTDRLDQLLDKIRLSGYSSLTSAERRELNALSQRLDNGKP